MSSFTFTAGYDAPSMRAAQKLASWPVIFDVRLAEATKASLSDLHIAAAAQMQAKFKNPTGTLEGSLQEILDSPTQGQMGTDLPYGPRRNWGFSGMTDSLGRYYANDPGIKYMDFAIIVSAPNVVGYYNDAAIHAFADVGV